MAKLNVTERNGEVLPKPVVLRVSPWWRMGHAVRLCIDGQNWKHHAIAALMGRPDGSYLSRQLSDHKPLTHDDLLALPLDVREDLCTLFCLWMGVNR